MSSHFATACLTDSGVALRYRAMSQSSLPGSPRSTLYWFSRSALPPNPPIPSSAVTKANSCFVLARDSSAGVGPVFARRSISSVTTFSICSTETPGRAVAMTANQLEISLDAWNAWTAVQSCRS